MKLFSREHLTRQLVASLPTLLVAALALGTYWLSKNAMIFLPPESTRVQKHEFDYYMKRFSIKTFDAAGQLKSEVLGTEARHFPDNDTLEIDQVQIRSYSDQGRLTTSVAKRALSNGDGSEVQLLGDAVVVREASNGAPRMEFQGEFLHAFLNDERVKSHKPVLMIRGNDQFTGNSLDYSNIERVAHLDGRVRGVLAPRNKK